MSTIDDVGSHAKATFEYPTLQDAFLAAAQAAVASFGRPVTGVLYTQAGRRFVSTSLPVKMLVSMARRDSAGKKEDPGLHRNRPLEPTHVKAISEYLRNEQHYLLPPVMLNATSPLQTFVVKTTVPTSPCFFVLPPDEYLFVTDGQHRLEALKQALVDRPELANDSIGVTIVEESDIYKVHQDFFDAAQVMPLAKSLLVEFDGREPMNWLTREVCSNAHLLHGRVEKIGTTVGKNSLMLFTTNQVKQGILQLLVGDWTMYALAMQKQAHQMLAPAKDLWKSRIIAFLDEFTLHNSQWRAVSERPLDSGLTTDIPGMREKYLNFSGGGLLVLCGVGHSILEKEVSSDGTLSNQQKQVIEHLAALDWSRKGELWKGYLVGPQGNITPHKNHIALAVAKAKAHLGLALSAKEEALRQRASAGELVPSS
ncbi:MAG: DNA sulfur modification protein DndB [Chloroflexi bacterium]|nr:DNA sulfur modification protein DndB [Chloroflexota bacterium]MBI4334216.1 DNA sulfur modification protein DndB [Chloroflexota bacterium]